MAWPAEGLWRERGLCPGGGTGQTPPRCCSVSMCGGVAPGDVPWVLYLPWGCVLSGQDEGGGRIQCQGEESDHICPDPGSTSISHFL